MREMAGHIEIISAERVRDELVKLIEANYHGVSLNLLDTGQRIMLPELPALRVWRWICASP